MSERSAVGKGFDWTRFQECKRDIEALIDDNNQRMKKEATHNQALEDSLKDLDWALRTMEKLLARVLEH